MSAAILLPPSWTRWEKRKQRGLVAIAIVAGALIASAPRNERRMFLLPEEAMAFAAVAAPEPTALRSPVMGYLDDGCSPNLDDGMGGAVDRTVEDRDCGQGRRRQKPKAAEKPIVPAAYFAAPDDPAQPIDSSPIITAEDISPIPIDLPDIRPRFFGLPIRTTAITPPVLLAGVPEPASWFLMLGGFGILGGALRIRRKPQQSLQA